jgi:ubiquinone/menaquinone biosynthesis C-methylase UbiE
LKRLKNGWRIKLNPVTFYEGISSEYDLPLHGNFYQSISSKLINKIPREYKVRSVLEVGAGTGFSTLVLRNRYPAAEITAIEPSISMLGKAQNKIPDIRWSAQNLADYSSSQCFDLVVCSMASHWFDKVELEKLFEIAKNSMLAISLPVNPKNSRHYANGNEQIRKLIWRLKPKPSWPKENRSFSLFYKKLGRYFKDLKVTDFQISENYDSYSDLANSLYARGVLLALFGEQAQEAKDILSANQNQDRKLQFDWFFKMVTAGNNEVDS